MKTIKRFIIVQIILAINIVLATAFIEGNFYVFQWNQGVRESIVLAVVFAAIMNGLIQFAIHSAENDINF